MPEAAEGRFKPRHGAMLAVLLIICAIALQGISSQIDPKLPQIHGVIIPEARALSAFQVVDQNDKTFSNQQLKGKWHLLSYGYTYCPDVCHTSLSILAKFTAQLKQQGLDKDLQILFYSIDHQRDTPQRLQYYLSLFSDDFIGLTHRNTEKGNTQALEDSLGMISSIETVDTISNSTEEKIYRVSHNAMLYLINPAGELQAVLKPLISKSGQGYFTAKMIYRDYRLIRQYFNRS
mgnify:CR=1 FL=1